MAKSKAKKYREKLEREGKRNPENGRGVYALANLTTKKTKTKQEKLQQLYKKERQSRYLDDRGEKSFFYFFRVYTNHIRYIPRAANERIMTTV
ncbi:hypothetical protein ACWE42_04880 [Sutcliffiella cohnii]